jgi:hypothetical protein
VKAESDLRLAIRVECKVLKYVYRNRWISVITDGASGINQLGHPAIFKNIALLVLQSLVIDAAVERKIAPGECR